MLGRLFFVIISGCSLTLGIYLTILQLSEYYNAYIITKVVTTNYPVWRLRFPAVTVCNYNVIYKDNIKPIKDIVMSDKTVHSELFDDFIRNLPLLIYSNLNKNDTKNFKKIQEILDRRGYNIDKVMAQLAHPCNNMIKRCFWQGKDIPCQYIIHSVKTNQGYCCSFSYYGTKDAIKSMIDPYNLEYTYSTLSHPSFGLRLLLDVEKDQYVAALKPFHGLTVLVQDGPDYPDMHLALSTLLMSEELLISVTPTAYVGTQDLRNVSPEKRRCLFSDESNIIWSSVYSYKTCVRQCKAKATYKFCNCVPFHFPLKRPKRLCTLSDIPCLRYYRYNFTAVFANENEFTVKDTHTIESYLGNSVPSNCTCYAQCNTMTYDLDVNKIKLTRSNKNAWYTNQNLSILNVYYSDVDCTKIERDVYFTWDRILASIGGIFSLCLGASMISIVEFFYSAFWEN